MSDVHELSEHQVSHSLRACSAQQQLCFKLILNTLPFNNSLFLENFTQYVLNMFTSCLPSHSFPPHFGIIISFPLPLPTESSLCCSAGLGSGSCPGARYIPSRDHIIKRTDSPSPSNCQMPLAQLVVGFCALPLSTSVLSTYQHRACYQAGACSDLCMMSQ